MPAAVVVGAQWGDEGKAKVIDYLAERSDVIIRFQGGANAGHTVIANGRKFIFHLVPSGIMYPAKVCVVGNGVVFDPQQFLKEVDELEESGISVENRLFISDLAHVVLPYHRQQDQASEVMMGGGKIGTTGRGIGPAYADKALRTGLRLGDLTSWESFVRKARSNFAEKGQLLQKVYGKQLEQTADEVIDLFHSFRPRLLPFITDTANLLHKAAAEGKRLLFEGAQGTFLDIDHGTYPFVTSSNTLAGAACVGSGIGPRSIDHVIGIVKTYTTRVGNGPFPTELDNQLGERLRMDGTEFGATTGRPRRCGWLDTVLLRKAIQLNGLSRLALTKLDVLDNFESINICTHYRIDGAETDSFPTSLSALERAVPVYETMPGWKKSTGKCTALSEFPPEALKYIIRIQELCYAIPVLMVSVGPDRSQTIEVEPM